MTPSEKLKDMKKKIASTISDNSDLDFIKDEIIRIIRVRTRLRQGVDERNLIPLKELSKKYVAKRKSMKLHKDTKPEMSNLTATGEMLDSIKGEREGTVFRFYFKGTRPDGYTNDEIAAFARKGGRPFFDLSESERNGLSRKIKKVIEESIKKLFDN